jgi:hypothetical protein
MKKIMAIILAAAMLATAVPKAGMAGDHGWATAGKIMTGIIGLHILGNVIANSQPRPVYVPETRYYAPEPRYYAPPRERVWIDGHYESRIERQWVPGHWEINRGGRDLDEDDWGDDDGGRGRSGRAWIAGHYRTIERQVWIPGYWEERG